MKAHPVKSPTFNLAYTLVNSTTDDLFLIVDGVCQRFLCFPELILVVA